MKLTTQRDADMASVTNMGDSISEKLGPRNPRWNKRTGEMEPSGEMIRFMGPAHVRMSVKPKNELMAATIGGLFAGTLTVKNKYGYMAAL